ncbi:hypothetical protein [Simiduia agarivorans]|uniref:Uncharacterized protein n=1 Tax=Simiduia agarivorans (strain DSM 21679 / JCM 13881 / BCRC 17597 / SA1) TaxID=1117647 RepID=K4KZK8_SIMAS|nr:hypothetical protein [Simiduia agarivorans]AFU99367.2 hypothetical protein M5M_10950 [Simiduia agarivorans SA1 = DSM 21679]
MNGEAEKFKTEQRVFLAFAQTIGLNTNHLHIEKGDPTQGEPDIRCHTQGRVQYFELTEACNPALAAAKQPDHSASVNDGIHNARQTVIKKLTKRYRVAEPIDLVIYTAGQTLATDTAIVAAIKPLLSNDLGPFKNIWFFGKQTELLASTAPRNNPAPSA